MATTEEEKKKQQPDAVEQAIRSMEERAGELRNYAASPVKIDTSGQPNWMAEVERVRREYTETPEQKAARERRESTNRRIAALTDGIVALSNVAGAMGGATPIKPASSLSSAHRAAVERAAKHRRENARLYDTARRYYSGLQYKQDKDNADRYNDEVKARLDAGKQADSLQGTATRLRQTKANADKADERARQRQQEQERHNRESEATARIRAAKTGSSRSGGSGNTQADYDEYARWEREHPDEVNQIRQDNAQINPYTGQPEKSITSTTVKLVNAKMRQKYGSPSGSGSKKKVSGFGGSQSSGKKKIAGFGN